MAQVLEPHTKKAGSLKHDNPRHLGDILNEMLSSNSPLAKGYRKYLASKENSAEKGGEV